MAVTREEAEKELHESAKRFSDALANASRMCDLRTKIVVIRQSESGPIEVQEITRVMGSLRVEVQEKPGDHWW